MNEFEWIERPGVEVGDQAEGGCNVVAKDSRSEVSPFNQTRHVEDFVILLGLHLRCKLIPISLLARVDPSPALVDLENPLAII